MTENTLKDEIRNYVIKHNNVVTSQEVQNYILKEKKMKTTPASIRVTLHNVLRETGGKLLPSLKPYGLRAEIRNFVIEHNNAVTTQEVQNYILKEKKMKTTPANIRVTLHRVLKETGGKLLPSLKSYGLRAEIRNYVIEHNNAVTTQEVLNYILKEKKMKTTPTSIRVTLHNLLRETGGKLLPSLKPYGLTAEIRNYVIEHNNAVTTQEVLNYILKEKKIETIPASIRCTLHRVLKETGGKLLLESKSNCKKYL